MAEPAALTDDALLDQRVQMFQPTKGYRAGMDAVMLAAAVEAEPHARLLEAGCGAGAALLCVAARLPQTRIIGVEREPEIAELARRNVARNGWEGRIEILAADALASWPAETFDGIFCNPPFDDAAHSPAPRPDRRHAYLTETTIEGWIKPLADRLTGGAALTMIHRAAALPAILKALEGRLGSPEVFPLRPREDAPASRVLVRARKGGRAPLRLLRGLDLHGLGGAKHTPAAEAILRGAAISW
jgi:tRNA1(Val) A37 N6-methylase TrmN6